MAIEVRLDQRDLQLRVAEDLECDPVVDVVGEVGLGLRGVSSGSSAVQSRCVCSAASTTSGPERR
jgi:hypothetical protein